MTTKIQKWGNSYAIRLPKQIVLEMKMYEGSSVEISSTKTGAIIKPIKGKRESLKEIMRGVRRGNVPELIDWGKPVGNEVW